MKYLNKKIYTKLKKNTILLLYCEHKIKKIFDCPFPDDTDTFYTFFFVFIDALFLYNLMPKLSGPLIFLLFKKPKRLITMPPRM